MKKVLIIAFSFPPASNIGAQRPYKLAKYFPKFGWEPIVLTPKLPGNRPDGIRIVETEYRDIKSLFKSKAGFDSERGIQQQLGTNVSKNFNFPTLKSKCIKLVKEIILYPDAQKGWYKFALKAAKDFLSKERVDIIISTSGPVTAHLIARELKIKYNIPWVADLRDLWSQNPYHVNKFEIIKYFDKRLELKTLSDADALVTVTDPWIDTFNILHKDKKVLCVTNGFDEDDFPRVSSKVTDKFTITYTGALYNGKRDPSILFKVIEQLIKENSISKKLIEIRFYGPKENWLDEEVKKYNLENIVFFYGPIPREEALKRQRDSQLLLLLIWNNKKEEGFCPGKVYEYCGARRPIIAFGWHGSVVKDMLEITNAGKFANNADDLKKILLEYYEEFVEFGEVKSRSNHNINNYTYSSVAKKYSEILNKLVST